MLIAVYTADAAIRMFGVWRGVQLMDFLPL
jgi:hypothetical protein